MKVANAALVVAVLASCLEVQAFAPAALPLGRPAAALRVSQVFTREKTAGVVGLKAVAELGGVESLASSIIPNLNSALPDAVRASSEAGIVVRLVGVAISFAYLFSPPSVLFGLLDRLIGGPLDSSGEKTWVPEDLGTKVGRPLGKGTFGTVYEAYLSEQGKKKLGGGNNRVVIKRGTQDGYSDIEAYFNRRARRLGSGYFASFLGDTRRSGDSKGADRLLVWKYEGSQTLEMSMQAKNFPLNLEDSIMGRLSPEQQQLKAQKAADAEAAAQRSTTLSRGQARAGLRGKPQVQQQQVATAVAVKAEPTAEELERRSVAVIRQVMKDTLSGLKVLHQGGVVHRDVKPANILISEVSSGAACRLIDLGAAADIRNGFNFDPETGLLDPRYAPPEQYIMPRDVPPPPAGAVALLGSPFIWANYKPHLFDSFCAGMTLLQLMVPQLRISSTMQTVNNQLKVVDFDVMAWRRMYGGKYDFSLLDRCNYAGWDLVRQLVSPKGKRASVDSALGHRFFWPEVVGTSAGALTSSKTLERD